MSASISAATINLKPGEGMYGATEPGEMTSEERMKELAEILARGYLRLLKKAPYAWDNATETEDENAATSDMPNGCVTDKSAS